jgi:hypothetical protein
MNSVMVDFESIPPDLTVDKLTEMIQAEFPGTRIINRDWYGEFRRHEVATIERLRRQGNPLRNAEEIVLASTDRMSAHVGPAFTIEIPMGANASLQGRIIAFIHAVRIGRPRLNASPHINFSRSSIHSRY